MKKLNLQEVTFFAFIVVLVLVIGLLALGGCGENKFVNDADNAPAVRGTPGAGGAGGSIPTSNGGVGGSQPTTQCSVTFNNVIGDGYGPRVAYNDNGFAVVWRTLGTNGLPMFQMFGWDGKPTSVMVALIGAFDVMGGTDDYLVLFRKEASLGGVEWSTSIYNSDGTLKPEANRFSSTWVTNGNPPFLSFDGTFYRISFLNRGCNPDANQVMGLSTGRVSAEGHLLVEKSVCGLPMNANRITGVVEQPGGPMISFWDAGQGGQEEEGSGLSVVDFAGNETARPLSTGHGYFIQASAKGPMLMWNDTEGNSYLSPIASTTVKSAYRMPKGMWPQLIDGDRVLDIIRDQLFGQDSVVIASLEGVQVSKDSIPDPPITATCFRAMVGKNGHYANVGSPCIPSGDPAKVFARVIECR